MVTCEQLQLDIMLAEAYGKLGILQESKLDEYIKAAKAYLEHDRERYIELADNGTPDYLVTVKHGRICKLIPLAQRTETKKEAGHVRENRTVLSLMLEEGGFCYIYENAYAKLYKNRERNEYSFPRCSHADIKSIEKGLVAKPAQEIRPLTTALEWESYCMAFAAYIKLCKKQHINTIPHKTERAMYAALHVQEEELLIGNEKWKGRPVPLARTRADREIPRRDHNYSASQTLLLLIADKYPLFVLRTLHRYSYFQKVIVDDVPGGVRYEPTQEKQQVENQVIVWEEIPEDMYPLYY